MTRIEPKTALTFEEKITSAFMHYVRGVTQQDIAIMMGGVNAARVNDACQAVRDALSDKPISGIRASVGAVSNSYGDNSGR